MTEKIVKAPTSNDVIDTINKIIDDKQDLLTAGTNISIVSAPHIPAVDTRSTATIVNVGSARWQGVAYGNGVYVAVGNNGYVAYSSDGVTWSTPKQLGTNSWYSITFANGKFVAVGNGGYTTTTTDGQTWTTPVQVRNAGRLQSVRYGNGIFLAVGRNGKATTSTDGQTWTTPVSFGFDEGNAIVYNGVNFVIFCRVTIASYNSAIVTTNDGSTFTTVKSDISMTKPSCITYGNNTYIIGREDTGHIKYSTDLVNWSESVAILNCVESIYWTGTQFIAVGKREITSTTYKYSTVTSSDGITWNEPVDIGNASSGIQYGFLSITSNGDSKFVAVGDGGGITTFEMTNSQDGETVINGAEIVSAVNSTSTNNECVGAKLFYDTVGNIETILHNLNSGSGVQ